MPNPKTQKIILAYVPVLHEGYQQFFHRHQDANYLYILNREIIAQFDHLIRKDIRALDPELILASLKAWSLSFPVAAIGTSELASLNQPQFKIIVPEEDELKTVVQESLPSAQIVYDSYFLRWDASRSKKELPVSADTTLSQAEFDQHMIALTKQDAQKSSDWWRQIGAAIVKNGQIIFQGYNHHVPQSQMPYVNGDPRGNFHKGEHIDLSTALHAEAGLIAQAAKKGVSLENAEMYVTTFPCPNCAKLIAYSGIKKVFFQEGYAMLDGESILKSQDVEIIKVTPEN